MTMYRREVECVDCGDTFMNYTRFKNTNKKYCEQCLDMRQQKKIEEMRGKNKIVQDM